MGSALTLLDWGIFIASLIVVMVVGLVVGRKEDTSVGYFLAGRSVRWWGIAGAIFGTNINAKVLVGMLGVGFAVGFAQSHFEITAIAGLLLLCYGFLPVYRKLQVFTLSEYLARRYDDRCRVVYAVAIVVIMVWAQMVQGLYIGARSFCVLLQGDPSGQVTWNAYAWAVLALAGIGAIYTIVGGLKAVIYTDLIQSLLLLAAGIAMALLTYTRPEVGGWSGMLAQDAAAGGRQCMHLFRGYPTDHPALPWTGVLTGLMMLHFFYWGTSQFMVQRALGAKDDRHARLGIIAAGFPKLLLPFVTIGTGVAASYLFRQRMPGLEIKQDAAFAMLIKHVIAPLGWGAVGLVTAGLVGAIMSSTCSYMNSAATVITFDFYKRYFNPKATDRQLILFGRLCIAAVVLIAVALTVFGNDPNSTSNFYLKLAAQQGQVMTGIVVAFGLGMFWKRATAAGALAAIVGGVVWAFFLGGFSNLTPAEVAAGKTAALWPNGFYAVYLGTIPAVKAWFGPQLNFLHNIALTGVVAAVLHVVISLLTRPDPEKSKMTWTGIGGYDPRVLRNRAAWTAGTVALYAALGLLVVYAGLSPTAAGVVAAVWTFALFLICAVRAVRAQRAAAAIGPAAPGAVTLWREDRLWAGVLCGIAMFMLFYFF